LILSVPMAVSMPFSCHLPLSPRPKETYAITMSENDIIVNN
jgi:hypothetical protein